MKKLNVLLVVMLAFLTITANAQTKTQQKTATKIEAAKKHDCDMKCGDDKDHKCANCRKHGTEVKASATAKAYACPMKCEGAKTYAKEGTCPKCKMDLKPVKAAATTYSCPMKCEGDRKYTKEGKCPKCKMDLKVDKKAA